MSRPLYIGRLVNFQNHAYNLYEKGNAVWALWGKNKGDIMKRFICLMLVLSLVMQTAPLAFAGGPGQIIILDQGAGGPVVLPKPGQNNIFQGQTGQNGFIFINPGQFENGKGGNPNIGQTNNGQYTIDGLPVGQTNDQQNWGVMQCGPSDFANYHNTVVVNSLRDYKKQQRRLRRGQCTVICCQPPYNCRRQYSKEEYDLLRLYAQQKHEREMMQLQMTYREKERARVEAQMAEERKRQTNMALFSCLMFTIPMTFATIQANKDARRSRNNYNNWNQQYQNYYRR